MSRAPAKAAPASTPAPPRQGGSTISRWDLTVEQLGAITAYRRMKDLVSIEQRVTASYCPNAAIRTTGGGHETRAEQRLEARQRLALIDREVFRNKPRHVRALFDDIVLNDVSAEQAGAHLQGSIRGKQIGARALVMLIADEIDSVLRQRMAA